MNWSNWLIGLDSSNPISLHLPSEVGLSDISHSQSLGSQGALELTHMAQLGSEVERTDKLASNQQQKGLQHFLSPAALELAAGPALQLYCEVAESHVLGLMLWCRCLEILNEQGVVNFHFALSPTSYVGSPGRQLPMRRVDMCQVSFGHLFLPFLSGNQFPLSSAPDMGDRKGKCKGELKRIIFPKYMSNWFRVIILHFPRKDEGFSGFLFKEGRDNHVRCKDMCVCVCVCVCVCGVMCVHVLKK